MMNHGLMQVAEIRSKISQIEIDVRQIKQIIFILVSHIFFPLICIFLASSSLLVYTYLYGLYYLNKKIISKVLKSCFLSFLINIVTLIWKFTAREDWKSWKQTGNLPSDIYQKLIDIIFLYPKYFLFVKPAGCDSLGTMSLNPIFKWRRQYKH